MCEYSEGNFYIILYINSISILFSKVIKIGVGIFYISLLLQTFFLLSISLIICL